MNKHNRNGIKVGYWEELLLGRRYGKKYLKCGYYKNGKRCGLWSVFSYDDMKKSSLTEKIDYNKSLIYRFDSLTYNYTQIYHIKSNKVIHLEEKI